MGGVARRISDWTAKSLLTALIVVLGLGFGRQVLQWWAADRVQPPAPSLSTDGMGDPAALHTLQFGGGDGCPGGTWSIGRQEIRGDHRDALAALRACCRQTISASGWPSSPPGPAEKRFLDSLASRPPLEESAGKWRLYALDDGLPMVAGVGLPESASAQPPPRAIAFPGPRVLTWGLAVPSGERNWTLYAFRAPSAVADGAEPWAEVTLPPDCQTTLAMRVDGGGAVIAFRGPEQVETWKGSLESDLKRRGWMVRGGWQPSGPMWVGRWEAGEGKSGSVDIQFGPDRRGGMVGVMLIAPPVAAHAEKGRS